MMKLLRLLCLLVVCAIHGSRADFDSCASIENCFIYFEGSCTNGRRNVCLSWANLAGCDQAVANDADNVCYENNFASNTPLAINTQICTNPPLLVPGGTSITFGIDDGPRNVNGAGPRGVNILGHPNNPATCSDYTNICASGGNNDIGLTFTVSSCDVPTTPAPTTVGPPTTMPPGCTCDPWIDWTPCSATCEYGTLEQRRTCRNCPAGTPLIRNVQCKVPRSCSVNGNWGQWMPWTGCTATCGTAGMVRSRSRVCNNPPPSGPNGLSCPGPATQSQLCPATPPCVTTTTRNPTTARQCRRAARRACPRGRRGRQCRQRFVRNCLANGL